MVVALFASCSDDDSSSSVSASKLEGKWYYVETKAQGLSIDYEHMPCAKDYLEFADGGVYREYEVWDCDGNTVSDADTSTGTYTLSGKKVTVTVDGYTETVTVKKLTGSRLELSRAMDMDEDGETDLTVTEVLSSNP